MFSCNEDRYEENRDYKEPEAGVFRFDEQNSIAGVSTISQVTALAAFHSPTSP
jgi:hypothetical protein